VAESAIERWRDVPGYEGLYQVSNLGNVRSFHASYRPRLRGDLLSPGPNTEGRATVVLYRDHARRTRLVHHLVLEAFVGPRPPGTEACHGPGGKTDNRLVNLAWDTHVKNEGDKARDGVSNRGERCGTAKLTAGIIADCKRRYAAGESQTALAREYGVTASAICEAVNGTKWSHLADGTPVRPRTWAAGEAHGRAKLTWDDVAEIRRRAAGGEQQRPLGREFGVSQPVISKIVRREIWRE
jgi:hypothetical protein